MFVFVYSFGKVFHSVLLCLQECDYAQGNHQRRNLLPLDLFASRQWWWWFVEPAFNVKCRASFANVPHVRFQITPSLIHIRSLTHTHRQSHAFTHTHIPTIRTQNFNLKKKQQLEPLIVNSVSAWNYVIDSMTRCILLRPHWVLTQNWCFFQRNHKNQTHIFRHWNSSGLRDESRLSAQRVDCAKISDVISKWHRFHLIAAQEP